MKWKKTLLVMVALLGVLALLAEYGRAQNKGYMNYNLSLQDESGRPYKTATTVTTYSPNSTTALTVYSNSNGAAIGTTLTSVTDGYISFWSGQPAVDLVFTSGTTAIRRVAITPTAGPVVMPESLANTQHFLGASISFEGATTNAFETTLSVTDPTADRAIVLPDGPGTVVLSSLATNAVDAANAVTGASNAWVFEGATADAFETSIAPTDATADRTVTLPDAGGTVMLSSLATNGADAANAVTGASNALLFEGATADDFEASLTVADPTADVTLTLPDDTGSLGYTPTGKTTLSGAGAVVLTHAIVEITSTGSDALTLANGENGQILTMVIVTDGGESTVTPTTSTGWATAVLTSDIDTITVMYVDDTVGWIILGTASDGTNLVAITQ